MKCVYYLTSTLHSTQQIYEDLQRAGLNHWFFHVISKDESGIKKERMHSGNFLEKLDILRDGILGGALGCIIGLIFVGLIALAQPFGPDVPSYVYVLAVVVLTLFGAWNGGLTGIASENKKIAEFSSDIAAGNYLILIYANQAQEQTVKTVMATQHPEARLVAVDPSFLNPLATLKRI